MPLLILNVVIVHLKRVHYTLILVESVIAGLIALRLLWYMLADNKRVLIFLNDERLDHGFLMLHYFHIKISLLLLFNFIDVLALNYRPYLRSH